jgi:hypothetical protein
MWIWTGKFIVALFGFALLFASIGALIYGMVMITQYYDSPYAPLLMMATLMAVVGAIAFASTTDDNGDPKDGWGRK